MVHLPGQLYAVARNAFLEAIRQPFYFVWFAAIGLGVVVNPHLSAYTFDDDNKMAVDLGLSMLLMGGLVLAAFTASGVISREIDNRTALTVISKPLPRAIFILGKYAGIVAALLVAGWGWGWLHLLTMRQGALSTAATPWDFPAIVFGVSGALAGVGTAALKNYLFGTHFGASAVRWLGLTLPAAAMLVFPFDKDFSPQSPLTDLSWPMLLAMGFVFLTTGLFAAVATACSTRLGQVSTLVICLVVFLVGIASDFTFGRMAAGGSTVGSVLYAALPNLQFLWLADAITQGTIANITLAYVAGVIGYTLILIAGLLGLAVALFQTRQAA